jgi:hypothetical protein
MYTSINVNVVSNSVIDQKPCGAATSDSMSGPGCTVFIGYPLPSSMHASFLTPDAVYDGTNLEFLKLS